jgi:hypothetical protein
VTWRRWFHKLRDCHFFHYVFHTRILHSCLLTCSISLNNQSRPMNNGDNSRWGTSKLIFVRWSVAGRIIGVKWSNHKHRYDYLTTTTGVYSLTWSCAWVNLRIKSYRDKTGFYAEICASANWHVKTINRKENTIQSFQEVHRDVTQTSQLFFFSVSPQHAQKYTRPTQNSAPQLRVRIKVNM